MKHWRNIALTLVAILELLSSLAACGPTPTPGPTPIADLTVAARVFVDYLDNDRYQDAEAMFSSQFAQALPAAQLQGAWQAVLSAEGNFQAIYDTRVATEQNFDVVYVTCLFDKGPLDLRLVFDDQGQIAGLAFVPTPPNPT
jgi:hypothetical protein